MKLPKGTPVACICDSPQPPLPSGRRAVNDFKFRATSRRMLTMPHVSLPGIVPVAQAHISCFARNEPINRLRSHISTFAFYVGWSKRLSRNHQSLRLANLAHETRLDCCASNGIERCLDLIGQGSNLVRSRTDKRASIVPLESC